MRGLSGDDQTECKLTPNQCGAYILAGGKNTRFGSDKALVEIGHQTQLLRLTAMLAAEGHPVEVVADRADRYEALGLNSLVDHVANCGPMAALATALRHRTLHHGQGWILFISCDQLEWRSQWWNELSQQVAPELQAITFSDCDDAKRLFIQPIPGMYHTSIEADVVRQLEYGDYSLRRLLAQANTVSIATDDNPRNWAFNTPQELLRRRP